MGNLNFQSNLSQIIFAITGQQQMKQVKKFIHLEFIVDVKNYRESFEKWMKIKNKFHKQNQQTRKHLFDCYLQVIKPIIHRFDQVISKYSSKNYGFYSSYLNTKELQIVRKALEPLKQFEIVTEPPQNLIDDSEVQASLKQEFVEIHRLNVLEKPNNSELKWWGNGLNIIPITIEGSVVTGKGEGRKNLGMPTANIQLSTQLEIKLVDYPNGVYLVDFDFCNGKSYRGAGCLGTNPHYQNFQERRRVEVYVLHDFGDEVFYGSKVKVTFRRLIRFEGKFHTFDAFLNAMHNDIQIARTYETDNKTDQK